MLEFFRKTGAEGGKKRAAKLSKAELTEIGKKGAAARWAKKPKKTTKAAASAKVRSAAAKKKGKAKE